MLAIVAEEGKVAPLLAPYHKEVSLAAINGPRSVVVSGRGEVIDRLEQEFQAQGITTQSLTVSHAFHSPLMDPILEKFKGEAEKVKFEPPHLDLVSNLTGTIFEAGEKPDSNYWKDHLRQAVRFSKGIESLVNAGYEVFLEIGEDRVHRLPPGES
jgi:acyl transferase domain-containing protein